MNQRFLNKKLEVLEELKNGNVKRAHLLASSKLYLEKKNFDKSLLPAHRSMDFYLLYLAMDEKIVGTSSAGLKIQGRKFK